MSKVAIKQQISILSLIVVLIMAAFFFLAWKPQMERLAELEKQWQDKVTKLETTKNRLTLLGEAKKSAAKTEAELIEVTNRVPIDPKLPALIIELQSIANDSGIDLLSLKPSEESPQGEFNKVAVSLSVMGTYASFIDFLMRIEKAQRSLKVSAVSIKTLTYPSLLINLTLEAFSLGGAGQAPPPQPIQSAAASNQTTN